MNMENNRYKDVEVTPMLLRIANTILCNYSMVNNNNLVDGKMGVCLFLYEYARLTGIKEYEDIADNLIDPILKSLHDGKNEDNINSTAGIGMGIIYLFTHNYLEDTDEHDALEAVDNLLFKTIERANTLAEIMIYPLFYFIYRCEFYRTGLDLQYSNKIATHIIGLYKRKECENEELMSMSSFILQHVVYFLLTANREDKNPDDIKPLTLDIKLKDGQEQMTIDYKWFNYLFGNAFSKNIMDDKFLSNLCQDCFYDAERSIGILCGSGLELLRCKNT